MRINGRKKANQQHLPMSNKRRGFAETKIKFIANRDGYRIEALFINFCTLLSAATSRWTCSKARTLYNCLIRLLTYLFSNPIKYAYSMQVQRTKTNVSSDQKWNWWSLCLMPHLHYFYCFIAQSEQTIKICVIYITKLKINDLRSKQRGDMVNKMAICLFTFAFFFFAWCRRASKIELIDDYCYDRNLGVAQTSFMQTKSHYFGQVIIIIKWRFYV